MSDESQESRGSNIVGRVAFVYRNEYPEKPNIDNKYYGWPNYGEDKTGNQIGYKRYDIVLKTGVGLKTPGLYHCIRDVYVSELDAWETMCKDGKVAGENENVTDETIFVLYLPMTDVYTFLKKHLKADNTIDITFYDEDLKDDDHPNGYSQYNADGSANTDYHNIKFNVNPTALVMPDCNVTVTTWENAWEPGDKLGGKSVIDVVQWLLCPYVAPKVSVSSPGPVWVGKDTTITWTATVTQGSITLTDGLWDSSKTKSSLNEENKATMTDTFSKDDPVGTTKEHKFTVQCDGKSPKTGEPYPAVYSSSKISVSAPAFYWYSSEQITSIAEISYTGDGAMQKGFTAKTTYTGALENGKAIKGSDKLYFYYLCPAGKVKSFVNPSTKQGNAAYKVLDNVTLKIANSTATYKYDLWRAGDPLSNNDNFKNTAE